MCTGIFIIILAEVYFRNVRLYDWSECGNNSEKPHAEIQLKFPVIVLRRCSLVFCVEFIGQPPITIWKRRSLLLLSTCERCIWNNNCSGSRLAYGCPRWTRRVELSIVVYGSRPIIRTINHSGELLTSSRDKDGAGEACKESWESNQSVCSPSVVVFCSRVTLSCLSLPNAVRILGGAGHTCMHSSGK